LLNAQTLNLPLHPLLLLYNVVCPCFLFVRALGQTHSLASFGLSIGFERLGKCEAFTNSIKNNQVVSNCVAVKRGLYVLKFLSLRYFLIVKMFLKFNK